MSQPLQTSVMRFRVSESLHGAAKKAARAKGMTVSEFVRDALRRLLQPGEHDVEPVSVGPDGLSQLLFARAAQGCLASQRTLRDQSWGMAIAGAAPFDQAFAVSEVFARMASAHGDANDHALLAGILFKRAQLLAPSEDHAVYCAAEALSVANKAADAGSEDVAALLAGLPALRLPAEILDLARAMHRADCEQEAVS